MTKITPSDINGLVGILPTPSTPDAGDWRCEQSVNLTESERMTKLIVDSGVDVLLTNGTFGECASLLEHEHLAFNEVVIAAVGRRVPIFAGIGTLNTRETIRRGRALVAAGADGLFVGRPMWLALDQKQIVRFYADLAEAMPGVPLIVYDNPFAFKGRISRDAYVALGAIPEVVASKHVGGPDLIGDAEAVAETCRILPLVSDWYRTAKLRPDLVTAAWTGHIACAPAPLVALARAIKAGDWADAEGISEKCNWAESAMFVGGELADFMNYSVQIGHLRFAAAGLIDPGPPRPPYIGLPEIYEKGGRETGRRWAELQTEFSELSESVRPEFAAGARS